MSYFIRSVTGLVREIPEWKLVYNNPRLIVLCLIMLVFPLEEAMRQANSLAKESFLPLCSVSMCD